MSPYVRYFLIITKQAVLLLLLLFTKHKDSYMPELALNPKSALPASPPSFHHFAYPTPPHVAQPPMNFTALAADSTELRCRAAQSARDKHHHKRSTNST